MLKNDTRDIIMTPEFVEKSDRDIQTICFLNDLAQKHGAMFVLSGGYATEAHCGGKIARPHGDIDGRFILTNSQQVEGLFTDLKEVIGKEETKLGLRKEDSGRIEFLEDSTEKDFFAKRRLEIKTHQKDDYNVAVEDGGLTDSTGKVIPVEIVGLSDLVAGKINKFFSIKDGIDTTKDRHCSISDYFDLKRLLALPKLDREAIRTRAPEEYDYVVSLMSGYESGS